MGQISSKWRGASRPVKVVVGSSLVIAIAFVSAGTAIGESGGQPSTRNPDGTCISVGNQTPPAGADVNTPFCSTHTASAGSHP